VGSGGWLGAVGRWTGPEVACGPPMRTRPRTAASELFSAAFQLDRWVSVEVAFLHVRRSGWVLHLWCGEEGGVSLAFEGQTAGAKVGVLP